MSFIWLSVRIFELLNYTVTKHLNLKRMNQMLLLMTFTQI